jgi:molybdopterin-guanine dinucleotide biosynthesis protein A
MQSMLQAGSLKIEDLFPALRVRRVPEEDLRPLDPGLRCFVNANTLEELETARRLAALGGEGGACAF